MHRLFSIRNYHPALTLLRFSRGFLCLWYHGPGLAFLPNCFPAHLPPWVPRVRRPNRIAGPVGACLVDDEVPVILHDDLFPALVVAVCSPYCDLVPRRKPLVLHEVSVSLEACTDGRPDLLAVVHTGGPNWNACLVNDKVAVGLLDRSAPAILADASPLGRRPARRKDCGAASRRHRCADRRCRRRWKFDQLLVDDLHHGGTRDSIVVPNAVPVVRQNREYLSTRFLTMVRRVCLQLGEGRALHG